MTSFNRSNKGYVKIYQELSLEPLRDRRWRKKLCLFYKVLENENPKYLFSLISTRRWLYSTENIHIPLVSTQKKLSQKFFSINHN